MSDRNATGSIYISPSRFEASHFLNGELYAYISRISSPIDVVLKLTPEHAAGLRELADKIEAAEANGEFAASKTDLMKEGAA